MRVLSESKLNKSVSSIESKILFKVKNFLEGYYIDEVLFVTEDCGGIHAHSWPAVVSRQITTLSGLQEYESDSICIAYCLDETYAICKYINAYNSLVDDVVESYKTLESGLELSEAIHRGRRYHEGLLARFYEMH